MYLVVNVVIKQVGSDRNKVMDIVGQEQGHGHCFQKHQLGLDSNEDMDMAVKVSKAP